MPTNGTDSLDRLGGVGPNTPTNYAGVGGSVDASPSVPALPPALALGLVILLLGAGFLSLRWVRRSEA